MSHKYQGYIGLVGKPNVGKSSLLNAIINKKVVITNAKAQTTRNNTKVLFENNEFNIIFVDTPGFHTPKTKLDEYLNEQSKMIAKKTDLIYFLINANEPLDLEDVSLLEYLQACGQTKVIVVFTKMDLVKDFNPTDHLTIIHNYIKPLHTISISNHSRENVDELLNLSKPYLVYSDQTLFSNKETWDEDKFLIREIIREQCLSCLDQEVPHGIAVIIDKMYYEKSLFNIFVTLVVEKESQKAIVIGKGGSMIKKIGTQSRHNLERIYDAKINLKMFVGVEKNWRNNPDKLKEFGYE